jgi:hypothetical protein
MDNKLNKKVSDVPGTENYELAIYIIMRVLNQLRTQMGLEAMLEYLSKYIAKSDIRHKDFKAAFSIAMKTKNLQKIYEATVQYEKQ